VEAHLQPRSIRASQCISKLAVSWPPRASLSSLDLGLQVSLHTRSITAAERISKFTQSRPPGASLSCVSNGAKEPASCPDLYRNNGSARLQNSPETRPAASGEFKPGPTPVNRRVSLGSGRPVRSNIRFGISGCSVMFAFRYANMYRTILTMVPWCSFWMLWPPV